MTTSSVDTSPQPFSDSPKLSDAAAADAQLLDQLIAGVLRAIDNMTPLAEKLDSCNPENFREIHRRFCQVW